MSNKKEDKEENVQKMIGNLVQKANKAQNDLKEFDQEDIDEIVEEMALAAVNNHMELADLAVEDTELGVYEDKVTKNLYSTEYVYDSIKDKKTIGVINENEDEGTVDIAEPKGVIAGITPVTNPTSTTIYKALIALKAGNSIIFAFHPQAQECSAKTAEILHNAAVEAGAPENCIQWIEKPSLEATNSLMEHEEVDLILATGGSGMVKAAYSSGTPAIGVGPGNCPAFVEKSADLKQAINDIVMGKTFDNGTICSSEQSIILNEEIAEEGKELLKEHHAYILNEEETKKVEEVVIDKDPESNTCSVSVNVVGQPATVIAEKAGIEVPEDTQLLVAPLEKVGPQEPLSAEKLSPVLGLYEVQSTEEGIQTALNLVEFGGLGHSAAIHSNNDEVIDEFGRKIPASRVIVNSPSALGGPGGLYNNLVPSMTLGCGSYGGNISSDNISVEHLYNIKTVAERKTERQWLKVPPEIYFKSGSLKKLSEIKGEKAAIITDEVMKDLGYVEKVTDQLDKANIQYGVFEDVEPDPSVETVMKGKEMLENLEADNIIALGGGSAIDAAKGMWLFYENPEATFRDLKLRFLDIKKRTYEFDKLGEKADFIAIPTTSGTGSEVTSFSVITDKKGEDHIKYPLSSYELTPDMAIIDPDLTMTMPPKVTANTGIDVLTHAIEAYVATMSSEFTDPYAMRAIELVFEYLPRAYKNGSEDKEAREKMHYASSLAGIAFTNGFLGINHSLAHIMGGEFELPHGLANGILLPHVIKYNSEKPTKLASYPNYEYHKADKKYAKIARRLGLEANTTEEGIQSLIDAIQDLMKELGMPLTISELGVESEEFEEKLDTMAKVAFNDQCTPANPRKPRLNELKQIYKEAYSEEKIEEKEKEESLIEEPIVQEEKIKD